MEEFRRSLPIVEAVLFDGTRNSEVRLCTLYGPGVEPEYDAGWNWTGRLIVDTPNGRMIASKGDWIVTNVWGERYPCQLRPLEPEYVLVKE